MDFKGYLITESNNFLGNKIGDILTATQELQDDMENLGARHIIRTADSIVNQIRIILHSQWSPRQQKHLEDLQRVAVALKKTIEEKGDIKEVIPAAVRELESISTKLGSKVTKLKGAEEAGGKDASQQDMTLTGDGPKPQQNQQMDQQNGQMDFLGAGPAPGPSGSGV